MRRGHVAIRRPAPAHCARAKVHPHCTALHRHGKGALLPLDTVLHCAAVQPCVNAGTAREVDAAPVCGAHDHLPPAQFLDVALRKAMAHVVAARLHRAQLPASDDHERGIASGAVYTLYASETEG